MKKPKKVRPVQANFRTTPDLKRRLEAAAEAGGLTFNKFVNAKLEAALGAAEDADSTRAPGLLAVAAAMNAAGQAVMSFRTMETGHQAGADWWNDPYAFAQAVEAANRIFESIRPDGESVMPRAIEAMLDFPKQDVANTVTHVGAASANIILLEIATSEPRLVTGPNAMRPAKLQKDLGDDLITRVRRFVERRFSK